MPAEISFHLPMGGVLHPTYAVVIGVATLVLQILALLSVALGRGSTAHKMIWSAVILLLPLVGVVLYLAFGKSAADRPLLD